MFALRSLVPYLYFSFYIKLNSKFIKDLNLRLEDKTIRRKYRENPQDSVEAMVFWV
jgi:hypothetical protein